MSINQGITVSIFLYRHIIIQVISNSFPMIIFKVLRYNRPYWILIVKEIVFYKYKTAYRVSIYKVAFIATPSSRERKRERDRDRDREKVFEEKVTARDCCK